MTREQILAMKPGRELDALIAEKVMNWPVREVAQKFQGPHLLETELAYYKGDQWVKDREWMPSSNMAAAWQVGEKLNGKHAVTLHRLSSVNDFYVMIGTACASGKDAPEAICKAALLAVMA